MRCREGLMRTLNCVNCNTRMDQVRAPLDITLDMCPDCRGVWYDADELETLLGTNFDYNLILNRMTRGTSRHKCPDCDAGMTSFSYTCGQDTLVIDQCTSCRGFWLDRNEYHDLKKLLQSFRGVSGAPSSFVSAARPVLPSGTSLGRQATTASARALESGKMVVGTSIDDTVDGSILEHYQNLDYSTDKRELSATGGEILFVLFFAGCPVELNNPRRGVPFTVWTLIIINVMVFIHISSLGDPGSINDFFKTYGLIPALIFERELYIFLTTMFIHASLPHLATNMYFLYTFGDNVCELFADYGKLRGDMMFLLFYLLCGIAASLAHALVATADSTSWTGTLVGASGAISGVIAAYWRAFPGVKLLVAIMFIPLKMSINTFVYLWVASNLMLWLMAGAASSVSWSGHLGGFVAGYYLFPLMLPFTLEKLHSGSLRE